jgi:hypothetical protein
MKDQMEVSFKKGKFPNLSYTPWVLFHPSNRNGYKGLRPWIILINTMIIAATSNIWIKPPAKPSKNPNSQRITRITTIVQIKAINLTSLYIKMYLD